ncbi:MAG: TatD family hydrolase [Planctomycetota bacterium]|nr:TatD family hydrolase [Planctomycetota bacterium]
MPTDSVASPPRLFIDTHAHLADARYADLDLVLRRARAAGVEQVVAIGTNAADSTEVVALSKKHPGVFAAVGVHPNEAPESFDADWDRVVGLAAAEGVVAIGETGLDRYWKKTPFDLQRDRFARHLELAAACDLPVVIHSRDCMRDVIDHLAALALPIRGVLHSFTGNSDEARDLVALGLHLSFAGMISFANKSLDPLREAAATVPLDRLLVETDSPYLAPVPHRGERNEPAFLTHTALKLAEIRGLDSAVLASATTRNARELFRLPADQSLET